MRLALRSAVLEAAAFAAAVSLLAPCVPAANPAESNSAGQPAAAPSLEGRWKLVSQTYEGGAANLAVPETPLHLELSRGVTRLEGKLWSGDGTAARSDWPAFRSDDGELSVDLVDRSEETAPAAIRVHYRVRPSAEDDLVLDIVERYEASPDGRTLAGTMRVNFTGGDSNRGGFTLHRVFERER